MTRRPGCNPEMVKKPRAGFDGAMPVALRLVLLILVFCLAGTAHAATALEAWRNALTETRTLAENIPPQAYVEAQRLQNTLPADATPADHVRVLNVLTRIEIYLALTAEATEHARHALELATQYNDRIGQAEAEINNAWNAINTGNMEALGTATTHAVAVLDGVDRPELLSEALLNMAMMYLRVGRLEEAISTTMQTMEIAKHTTNPLALAYASQGLAISFSLNDRPKEALEQHRRMRAYARAAHSKILEALAVRGIGSTLDAMGDHQPAGEALWEAVRLFRETGNPFGISHALFGVAAHLQLEGQHDKALPLFNEIIATYKRYRNPTGLWYVYDSRSTAYLALGNHAASLDDANRAYMLAKQLGLSTYLSNSAQRLASIYAAMGDHQHAYKLSLEAAQETANAARKKASDRMLELVQRYEKESRQREIDELTRHNLQQKTELRQRELQQRWLWTVLTASVMLLAVTMFFLMRLRSSHAVIRSLNASLEHRVQTRTAELRQQARYLRTLIDTLPWRVWLKDTSSRYLAVNQAAADTCGLSADELIGKTDLDVHFEAIAVASRADDLAVMASRQRRTTEERQVVADKPVWMETFKAPVLDEDGTVLGTVGLAHDISERKAAEASREAALAEAQRLARVRSEFLAQMSHELRTPLNGILGYVQILRRDMTLHDHHVTALNVIQQSGEHLLTLINDILDFAKIEAGKFDLCLTETQLPKLLQVIAETVNIRAAQKNLDFQCNPAPGLPTWVRADEKRLRQILLNLLSNAVKFTDRGMVQLCVGATSAGRIRFEVRDTGVGIGSDQLEFIFRPFEQAGDMQRRIGGTGLGLAISRQLVHMMRGDIRVESRVGEGSTFWFELDLPAIAPKLEITAHGPGVIGYAGPHKNILVVDDILENRAVLAGMLGPLGFEVSEATNGMEGLDKAQALRPDLILMDLVMPGMDGLEATRRLRMLPALQNVPIIAISASASIADQEKSMAAGTNAFLAKPVDFDSLLSHVANLLGLDLIYESSQQARPIPEEQKTSSPAVPPENEIQALYKLAQMGNMQNILRWANHVEALDACYKPFADQLRTLAKGYQSKAILNLAKRYMETETKNIL